MKHVLSALTLLFALASPAWSTSDNYRILDEGKILYAEMTTTIVDEMPMKAQEIGVAYNGNIYVCQITFSLVFPTSELKCFSVEDKGLFSIKP